MTKEDIIKLARQAYGDWYPNAVSHELERFAELVAAAERNKEEQENGKYFCPVCNRQEMVRAKFDEESG
jgi:ribosomal protein L37AE/L43A